MLNRYCNLKGDKDIKIKPSSPDLFNKILTERKVEVA